MKTIEEKINYYKESLDLFDDGMDKYKFLIDQAKNAKNFPEEYRNDSFKVSGCQAQVWLVPKLNENFVAAVPPFARYAYEVWIIPKVQIEGPWKFNDKQTEDFSKCIQQVVKGYDSFLNKRCPYIMGLHASPELDDSQFHFHVEFYPPLRHGDKPKILAGSESMAGVFIMDVLPEDSAKVLRKFMS